MTDAAPTAADLLDETPFAEAAKTAQTVARWSRGEILALFELPFMDLLARAHDVHRENFDPNKVQLSTLLNIKTGGCAENCKYCSQSSAYDTGLKASKLMDRDEVMKKAGEAKDAGAGRFCMGAAWRELKDRDLDALCDIVSDVKGMGLETCMTLGMLTPGQAQKLRDAGLDYYNHNLDTSPEYYKEVVTTRSYEDRLQTLANVRATGMNVCSGGIIGMGESREDRAGLLEALANLEPYPESVPINMLVPVPGTPMGNLPQLDTLEWIRTIAVARITMPKARVRLSAGRTSISDEAQAMAFFAGANSIFYGEKLLTTENPEENKDMALLERLGMSAEHK
ncbi:Biotin synthase [Caenispirillum salinarum AK4]|uniref:Biotin synthase n=1 Tax=Caenispirillum salinarum AK4 TaxID=1238182 RepID=K9HR22_9PROT|nr:biotin synthase BioB [Caenispirillum salinarum]EKV30886.1 Biotin synthase [Caenispirillum salinarum AK4]